MKQDFLLEIGTEELPPKALVKLTEALAQTITVGLHQANLAHGKIKTYATPRRLAILIQELNEHQPDQLLERRGPALQAAYDKNSKPTKAALGFATSCNTTVAKLSTVKTAKGAWLFYEHKQSGQAATKLLPEIVIQALKKLPIPRPMHWGDNDIEFIRPVHWVAMLYGSSIIKTTILGLKTDRKTYGHRFHHPKAIVLPEPKNYEQALASAYVIADFSKRRAKINKLLLAKAKFVGIDTDLLNEVTALVEWPQALLGKFPPRFLKLPPEVLITSMKKHQKCFPVYDQNHKLLPNFTTISNIKSRKPQQVITGNERVINARLTDAEFFYHNDLKAPLQQHLDELKNIIFQNQLGSMYAKTTRITSTAAYIAATIKADVDQTKHAATLAKTDLMTAMVGEFPNLQGIMGYYYAKHYKEPRHVATALKEQYLPRFANDILPATKVGAAVAIADKLDTITGIFGINQAPTGAKDPFGLRRAALGILRIIIEKQLDLDLAALLAQATQNYTLAINPNQILAFLFERLRSYYLEQGISPQVFAAVLAKKPTKPLDFAKRINAVTAFQLLPEAEALAAANKRVSNILKKASEQAYTGQPKLNLLVEQAEQTLYQLILVKEKTGKQQNYTEILIDLAELKQPIDNFFDTVMVMSDELKLCHNRLKLLNQLRQLFLQVADISLLPANAT